MSGLEDKFEYAPFYACWFVYMVCKINLDHYTWPLELGLSDIIYPKKKKIQFDLKIYFIYYILMRCKSQCYTNDVITSTPRMTPQLVKVL